MGSDDDHRGGARRDGRLVPAIPHGKGAGLTRVLVTGATGYVGSRLCHELEGREGVSVRALVRRRTEWLRSDEQTVDDLSRPTALQKACAEVDAIVHLAGSNEIVAARTPDEALADTAVGTLHLASAAEAAGVRRFVYLSTVHVYGAALVPNAHITEDTVPQPRAVYGIARLAAEQLAQATSMDVVVLRLTNSVGAPAHPAVARWTLVANDLCRQAATEGELRLRTDGLQWRDFVPLADVCNLLADTVGGALPAGTYNVGSGRPLTIRALAELVQVRSEEILGHRPPLHAPEASAAATAPYVVCVEKLGAAGYELSADISGSIDETLRFCLDHKDELTS